MFAELELLALLESDPPSNHVVAEEDGQHPIVEVQEPEQARVEQEPHDRPDGAIDQLDVDRDAELDDLQMLVQLGANPKHKHQQRSWDLLNHARAAKKQKSLEQQVSTLKAVVAAEKAKLITVAAEYPLVAKTLGLSRDPGVGEERAKHLCRLAFMPSLKGNISCRNKQNRACAVVSRVLQAELDRYSEVFFGPVVEELAGDAAPACDAPAVRPLSVKLLGWEWDETSQRLQALRKGALRGERKPLHQVSVQVMVQKGVLVRYEYDSSAFRTVSSEPYFVKARQLELQTADYLLHAMLSSMPIDISNLVVLNTIAANQEALVLAFACDRASANKSSLRWMFNIFESPSLDRSVLAVAEPCAAHGVALSKARAVEGKALVATASSFTCLSKNWRFMDALRDSIIDLVSKHLTIKREARPRDHVEATRRLIQVLFGDLLVAMSENKCRKGPSQFEQDLGELCQRMSLLPGCGLEQLCHYCWVEVGSSEFKDGLAEGSACCRDRDEAISKVAVPLINLVINSSWTNAAASRWTYVSSTFRRLCLGFACHGLLQQALRDTQVYWNCAGSMEATLQRAIAADSGDFHSRSRLRLLRVVQGFCQEGCCIRVGIVLATLLVVDKILFRILGNGEKGSRATVADMVSIDKSPIARASQDLLSMLASWGPGSRAWEIVEVLGCDFGDESMRKFARSQIMHLCAGLVDVFELRYSLPPYTLLQTFTSPQVTFEQKSCAFEGARQMHPHCRSLFLKRLLELCPTMDAMLSKGAHILRAWAAGATISVDFSERSHAQMRCDMRSSGRAKSASASAGRVFCQQVRADIVGRKLPDPSMGGRGGLNFKELDSDEGRAEPKEKAQGGNPYFDYLNFSVQNYKETMFANKKMTEDDMKKVRARVRAKWEVMSVEERESWLALYRARRMHDAVVAVLEASGGSLAEPQAKLPLWFLPSGEGELALPLGDLAASSKAFSEEDRRKIFDDPGLRVMGPVPRRASSMPKVVDGRDVVFGCGHSRQNICRHTLGPEVQVAMDQLCSRLNAFVGGLGVDVAKQGHTLLWLRALPTEAPVAQLAIDMVLLLADSWYSPTMQYWGRCALAVEPEQLLFSMPDFPCLVVVARKQNRATTMFEEVDIATSDEIAHEAALMRRSWELRQLEYSMQATANLLEMRIIGAREVLEVGRTRRKKTVRADTFDSALFLSDDPIAVGTLQGAPSCSPAGLPGEGPEVDVGALAAVGDGEPSDMIADVLDCDAGVAEEAAFEDEVLAEVSPYRDDPSLFQEDFANADFEDEASEEQAVDVAEGVLDPQAGARSCMVSGLGYVSTPLQPWCQKPNVGRITTWPANQPLSWRSVSMTCYMHSSCKTPARRRGHVTDAQLLTWLFSMAPLPPGTPTDVSRAKVAEHKALFAAIEAESSGGASGSGS